MGDERDPGGPDAAVIAASLDDPHRFGLIFTRHVDAVHRYLARRVDAAKVDDVVADTFVAAFRTRAHYDVDYPDARPWLFGIATNMVRHHHRAEGRRRSLSERLMQRTTHEMAEDDTADEALARGHHVALSDIVQAALARLDPTFADVLTLHAGPQLTYEEIARALGVPVGTVRSRMSRGRAQLRELLGAAGQYLGDDATNAPTPLEEEHRP